MKVYTDRQRPFNKEVPYDKFNNKISGLKMQIQAGGSHTREVEAKRY